MSNNKNDIIKIGVAAAAIITIFIAVYLYFENKNKKEKIAELEDDRDNLELILCSLKQNPNISENIKQKIKELILKFSNVDKKVANELTTALNLLQIGYVEKAIEDLVKIIEHLLTIYCKENESFASWQKEEKGRRFDLHNYLLFCKEKEIITDIEYQFFNAIKKIRNEEAHNLDFKNEGYLNEAGLITAIGGIIKIALIVYPQIDDSQNNLTLMS
ncbi:MAG TPA: hypothetical protein PLW77_04350 [Bacteroidales bacterium]|nr:hypothetical protein [Bacteroidales bacterium]HQB22044.1 hypothetical protein [Bacteroidales bacterium]